MACTRGGPIFAKTRDGAAASLAWIARPRRRRRRELHSPCPARCTQVRLMGRSRIPAVLDECRHPRSAPLVSRTRRHHRRPSIPSPALPCESIRGRSRNAASVPGSATLQKWRATGRSHRWRSSSPGEASRRLVSFGCLPAHQAIEPAGPVFHAVRAEDGECAYRPSVQDLVRAGLPGVGFQAICGSHRHSIGTLLGPQAPSRRRGRSAFPDVTRGPDWDSGPRTAVRTRPRCAHPRVRR
jgi:hypothetical protein